MTTVYSAWQGTGSQARIRLDYTVGYSADRTQAIFNGTFYAEFGGSISDSTNAWAISGDCGSASGSNIPYSIPSGGGVKAFKTMPTVQQYGAAVVAGSIDNVEGIGGGQILGTFTLPTGGLAPYFNNTNYGVRDVSQTSATTTGLAGNANGGALNNLQFLVNTSATEVGAGTSTPGAYVDATISTLTPDTLYYYKIRIANSTYGWSAWGPWKTFRTLPTIPNPAPESWYIADLTQISAVVKALGYTYDGGSPIDQVLVRVNTAPNLTGYWDLPGGWEDRAITGLTPGTTYYVCVYLHNAYGYSAPTAWKAFTTLPGVSVNVGGVWKNAVPYVNVGGVWKQATRYVNVGGVWKQ